MTLVAGLIEILEMIKVIEKGKFGVEEAVSLLVTSIIAKLFYDIPAIESQKVGTSMWYMMIIAVGIAFLVFTLFYHLLKKFPGKNIMEIYDIVLGQVLGFVFSLLIAIALMGTVVISARKLSDVLMVYTLQFSPLGFILLLLIAGVVIQAYLGLESLVRFSRLFFYVIIFGLVALVILSAQNYDINRIFPIFGYGLGNTISRGITSGGYFREIIVIGIFAGSFQGTNHIKKIGHISLLWSGIIFVISFLSITIFFPYAVVQELLSPMYVVASLIEYGRFFQRLEALFIFAWSICSVVSISLLFYSSLAVYCHIFRIKDKRPVVLPYAIIFFTLCMMPDSYAVISGVLSPVTYIGVWVTIYIPLIITLIVSWIRDMKGGKNSA
jgi:spore germination protein KB